MKLGPKEIKEINQYLITGRNKQREFVTDDTPAIADGGRIGFNKGERVDLDYINLTRIENAKKNKKPISDASKFKYLPGEENITYTDLKDKKTGKVTRKYNVRMRVNTDGKQKVITKGSEFQNINSLNKAKKIRDDFRKKNPKNIKPRDPKKDYVTKDKRRKAEIKTSGRLINFKAPKGYVAHHMTPLAGRLDMTDSDIAIVSEKMNTAMSKYDKPMNALVNESMELDFNDTKSLKKMDDINKKLASYVKQMEKELGPKYKGLLGFNKLTPVLDTFDDKGQQIFSIEKVGTDFKKSISGKKEGEPLRKKRLRDIQAQVADAPTLGMNLGLFRGLGEAVKAVPTPLGTAALTAGVGVDPKSSIDRASIAAEAAFAPQLVQQSAKMGAAQRFFNLGLPAKTALRLARLTSPIGIAALGAEGLYQAGKFTKKRMGELKAMSPEQRQELRSEGARQAFDPFMAAGGGIAKEAGDPSGRPPESGPQPQGLLSLKNRVRNY